MTVLGQIEKIAKQNGITFKKTNLNLTLKDLGIDSLEMMGLIVNIEDSLGVTLDDETLNQLKTLNDLVNAFEKKLEEKHQ